MNKKKKKKVFSHEQADGSASNRTRDSCSSIVIEVNIPAGADHPPPSRYYLYTQSRYIDDFILRLGNGYKKKWTCLVGVHSIHGA
jgi:hypothetical protein